MPDFEALVEQSPDLFTVVDEDGTVRYQSGAIERFGYDPAEFVGESFLEYVHPDDRDRIELRPRGSNDADGAVEYRFRRRDGSWTRLQTLGRPQFRPADGSYSIVSRVASEPSELERALERYAAILDSLDDAVYAIDPDGTIAYVNEAYASMKGVDRDDLLGTDIYEWGSESATKKIKAAREAVADEGRDVGFVEFDFTTVDGETIPVEMRFSTVTRNENELERVGAMRDISDRKARERALRRKNERLERFASIVSHDLRNPLNVASGNLSLLGEECDSDRLDEIAVAHDRMAGLIDDLLALARAGEVVTDPSAVDLGSIVDRSWRSVETENATVRIDTDRTVVADAPRLQRLLENLIRNSVEHGGSDVTVTVGDLEGGFFFGDDGGGIPVEERDRVFDSGYSTTDTGTGLGLEIVSEIVDAHGWSIAIADGTNGGARFEITGVEVGTRSMD
ncbi:PAS domain S-box protein [Natronolimnohabitans innermongolicus]|uniref:histidine kinase n=1 Tax=Natronolimnohabitans innermongolicus JCM 12255 TaxID=1227499 RepID=L9WW59_9EURY|nr:PAS domain S-box protein [Natronolimnohabitans innermongolicus]ELY52568.1 PAS/PAC sensor signal transduction histidine kinase [Natronolimnohabitans innermongolicus JCM 12255]